jgi:hypothetical protein
MDRWLALVKPVMKYRLQEMQGISYLAESTVRFSRKVLLHGVNNYYHHCTTIATLRWVGHKVEVCMLGGRNSYRKLEIFTGKRRLENNEKILLGLKWIFVKFCAYYVIRIQVAGNNILS